MTLQRFAAQLWRALALVAPAAACSFFYQTVDTGPSFRVRVADHGRPVHGVAVELQSAAGTISATTDGDGIVRFEKLSPGTYELGAKNGTAWWQSNVIQVKPTQQPEVEVALQWPSLTPQRTSSLTGSLSFPGWTAGQALALDLVDARSGRQLQRIITRDGRFSFQEQKPGYYLLQVGRGRTGGGALTVEVDPQAPAGMESEGIFTSCGMQYSNLAACRQPELQLGRLEGSVTDSASAAVPRAELHLFAGDRLVQKVEAGDKGEFSLGTPEDGIYQLVVRAPGFASFRTPVKIDGGGGPGPVQVSLGHAWGGCGAIRMLDQ